MVILRCDKGEDCVSGNPDLAPSEAVTVAVQVNDPESGLITVSQLFCVKDGDSVLLAFADLGFNTQA